MVSPPALGRSTVDPVSLRGGLVALVVSAFHRKIRALAGKVSCER
jgi:hypothetical protein